MSAQIAKDSYNNDNHPTPTCRTKRFFYASPEQPTAKT